MKRILIGLVLTLTYFNSLGQFQFRPNNAIEVRNLGGQLLKYPWAGGICAGQFQQMDLDNDGLQDLVVFDRGDGRFICWLRKIEHGQTVWHHRPDLASSFPEIQHWCRLIDYDGDGRVDLFAANNGNIDVYKNISTGSAPQFQQTFTRLNADFGFGFPIRVFVLNMDYPGIDDLDGDGDIDFLAFDNGDIGFINYYRNMAVERYNRRDTFDLIAASRCYGRFAENQTNSDLVLGLTPNCTYPPAPLSNNAPIHQRVSHLGSTLTPMKFNADTLTDLLIGDIEGTALALALNTGTRDSAHMTQKQYSFPAYDSSAFVPVFPVAYNLDLTGNPKRDLIVTINEPYVGVLGSHVWLYENKLGSRDSFQLKTKTFLIEDILQYGRFSAPEFADVNNDGIEDLLIAQTNNANQPIILLLLGQANGSYQMVDTNFLNTKSITGRLRIGAGDLNNDGKTDLLLGTSAGTLMYYQNNGTPNTINYQLISPNYQQIVLGGNISPELADINGDGLIDLLLGTQRGRIAYYQNSGTASNPMFTLVTDSIGRIDMSAGFFNSHTSTRLADFNNNGTLDLIASGEWGNIALFPDITNNIFTKAPAAITPLFYYPLTNISRNSHMGSFPALAIRDVNNDNFPDLFVGTFRGGIEYYDNTSTQVSVSELKINNVVKIYPNPANEYLRVEVNQTNAAIAKIRIMDLSGRTILEEQNQLARSSCIIETANLIMGYYLLEVVLQNGQTQYERFIKN